MTESEADQQRWIEAFHRAVDEAAAPVARANAARLQCKAGCASCCVDELTVFEIEADVIRHHHAALLADGIPHSEGACAFLDEQSRCRIYEHRPYVCRTQGLPLRWLAEDEETDEIFESRDICPLNDNDGGPPIEELAADECWTLGPFEQRLADQQAKVADHEGARVPLRSLFAAKPSKRHLPITK
jgi:uncharacterized protein